MCGRIAQYHGTHDFVAVLSMPGALVTPSAINRWGGIT